MKSSIEMRIENLEKHMGMEPAQKQTNIVFVLDSSGSMGSCQEAAIKNFNDQAREIQKMRDDMGLTRVSCIVFGAETKEDDRTPPWDSSLVKANYLHRPADYVKLLDNNTYRPYGMTPMYDAIGWSIEEMEEIDDGGPDTAFLLIVITDGLENASRRYNASSIREKISALKSTGRWTVQMMGAEEMDLQKAEKAGFDKDSFTRYKRSKKGLRAMSGAMRSSVSNYASVRSRGVTALNSLQVQDTEETAEDDQE